MLLVEYENLSPVVNIKESRAYNNVEPKFETLVVTLMLRIEGPHFFDFPQSRLFRGSIS